ncbi:NAD(P)H-dependent amine dehydrogenase family protein [Tomitella fengzijianii]|uniref:Diacylglycerol kinase n=1 Tax=Tomitella fengzijianii TaxID=2597660 RepID=A0A516X817_9ACTN|nr:diacylglycerol kinase [Tomitella fengzijianii]QDQ99214.1 diacylglycerol kinase [Tomitella fengzijianii]
MALRVVEWSTGTVGRHAIAGIDARPELELVGVWVSNPDKAGRDAGQLAGLGRELGVRATTDRDALLALKPDCIVHTAMTDDRIFDAVEDLIFFLEHGVNVVSSGPVILQYPRGVLPDDVVERIRSAGVRGGASLHVNGIDPGFANDVLPLAMTSLSQRINQVRCVEIADYSTYDQAMTMTELFGFGGALDQTPFLLQPGVLSLGWGSVVRQIAAGLGLTLDEPLVERHERLPAEEDFDTVCCHIAEGTAAALRFEVIGTVGGEEKVVLEHVTRTAPGQAPDWPRPTRGDGCYRVEVTGQPSMTVDLHHHGEHGDHNDSGMIMTAMRLVNAVEAVVAAEPGIVTALDLPPVTGRGLAG